MSGAFLILVYSVINRLPDAEMGLFISLLRLFTVLAIPAVGLQVVMAQEAAAAVTEEDRRRLAMTSRAVLRGIVLLWFVIVAICAAFSPALIQALKITSVAALWTTLGLVLGALCLPFAQGLLQGMQKFSWLAGSVLLNGVGRFVGILAMVVFFKTQSAGALFGALIGVGAAVLVGLWPVRHLLSGAQGKVDWKRWLQRFVPLTGGAGAALFVVQSDVLFVQNSFASEISRFYSAVAVLGLGLVSFTAPMAAVMFPKLVSSLVQSQKSNSLTLALTGTALLAGSAAIACTLLPWLPLRILHYNKPDLWASDQLVPWFMWAMVPATIANVLINNLLARQQFSSVPWLVGIAIAYGFNLHSYLAGAAALPHFAAFKGVILRLGVFSSLLLLVSAIFTFWPRKKGKPA